MTTIAEFVVANPDPKVKVPMLPTTSIRIKCVFGGCDGATQVGHNRCWRCGTVPDLIWHLLRTA